MQQNSMTQTSNEQYEEQGTVNKKHRGRTQMQNVHARAERKLIVLNELNQPVGPTKKDVSELSSFLETLGRNSTFCPLNIFDWRKISTKDDLWEYVKGKYDIPDAGKKWALQTIQHAWRSYKSRLKKEHFDAYENDEMRMEKRPCYVSEAEFRELLNYWNSDKFKKISEINTENRRKLKNPHTVGKKSFAIVRTELATEKEAGDPLTLKEGFEKTRARKPGRLYKVSDEDTTSKLAEMEQIESQQSQDENEHVNAFTAIMGPEHPGRLRLYGRGVKKTSLKGKMGIFEPSSSSSNMQTTNMEEMMQRMEEKLEEKRSQMQEEIMTDILSRLRRLGVNIDLDMLATPRENTAQIHRPSTGSNNQGELGVREENEDNE